MDEGIECRCWLRNKKDENGKDTDVVLESYIIG